MVPNKKDFVTFYENIAEKKIIKVELLFMTRKWRGP
jgi:hypothetical protein